MLTRDAASGINGRVWGCRVSFVCEEAVNHPRPNTASFQTLLNPWKRTHRTPKLQPLRGACGAAAKTQGGETREGEAEVGTEAESGQGRRGVS